MRTSQINIKKIDSKDIDRMTTLLIERQNIEGETFPFLKHAMNDDTVIRQSLVKIFSENHVIGMGLYTDDLLDGYMFGLCIQDKRLNYVRVPYEGMMLSKHLSTDLLRHLYKPLSAHWVKEGYLRHEIYMPLGDQRYQEALFNLCFYQEQAYAIRDIASYVPFQLEHVYHVRIANADDSDVLSDMSDIIYTHQQGSPVYAIASSEYISAIREGYKQSVFDKDMTVLLAEKDKQSLGFQMYEPLNITISEPKDCVELVVAGTKREARGLGVGKALMNEGIQMMKKRGYQYIKMDWRIANLTSSRFWPSCGFKPYIKRMVRIIDQEDK